MNKQFNILNRSKCIGALMDEEKVVYVLYSFKGYVFRLENGKLTKADAEDRKLAERWF